VWIGLERKRPHCGYLQWKSRDARAARGAVIDASKLEGRSEYVRQDARAQVKAVTQTRAENVSRRSPLPSARAIGAALHVKYVATQPLARAGLLQRWLHLPAAKGGSAGSPIKSVKSRVRVVSVCRSPRRDSACSVVGSDQLALVQGPGRAVCGLADADLYELGALSAHRRKLRKAVSQTDRKPLPLIAG
jgi:hypothetical protein